MLDRTRCLIYSRVVGYLRPVSSWNPGKQEEFSTRRTFSKVVEAAKKEMEENKAIQEDKKPIEIKLEQFV